MVGFISKNKIIFSTQFLKKYGLKLDFLLNMNNLFFIISNNSWEINNVLD